MKLPLVPMLAIVLALAAPPTRSADYSPEVQTLLHDVATAYQNLSSFSMTFETVAKSPTVDRKFTTKLSVQKPTKLSAEITSGSARLRVVADGTNAYADRSNQQNYTKAPVTKLDDALRIVAASGGSGLGLLPILLTSPQAEQRIIPIPNGAARILPEETVSNVVCVVLEVTGTAVQPRYRFLVGKQDHLLRRVTVERPAPALPTTETYWDIDLNPVLKDSDFTYTPPPGAVAVSPASPPDMFDARLKVATTPFPITGKDLAGKAVSLDDYKGKVLLLDFWAIWCGPCIAELPNVIAAYNKFHERGFEILGISLDRADDRGKLEAFVVERKMPWRQIYDGKYWEAENAVAYGVHAIPFTLLIGKDGKIAAVNARDTSLAPAIEAALSAK